MRSLSSRSRRLCFSRAEPFSAAKTNVAAKERKRSEKWTRRKCKICFAPHTKRRPICAQQFASDCVRAPSGVRDLPLFRSNRFAFSSAHYACFNAVLGACSRSLAKCIIDTRRLLAATCPKRDSISLALLEKERSSARHFGDRPRRRRRNSNASKRTGQLSRRFHRSTRSSRLYSFGARPKHSLNAFRSCETWKEIERENKRHFH